MKLEMKLDKIISNILYPSFSFTEKAKFTGIFSIFMFLNSCTNTECVSTRNVKTFQLRYDQNQNMYFPEPVEVEVCDQHIITNLPERKQKKSLTNTPKESRLKEIKGECDGKEVCYCEYGQEGF